MYYIPYVICTMWKRKVRSIDHAELSLRFQIRGGKQLYGGHNLPFLVGIGLTELPNSEWPKNHPVHPLTTSLNYLHVKEL